jgi:arsenate reductase
MIEIYHNPRCTKSRECLAFFEDAGVEYKIIKYLIDVPTHKELTEIIRKLGIAPIDLIRQKERLWIERYQGKKLSDKTLIDLMVENPILIERPIVINGNDAVIARPIEKAAPLLK